MPKTITLLGSTGSIGTQSLDVARMHGYRIFGLAANSRVEILQKQIEESLRAFQQFGCVGGTGKGSIQFLTGGRVHHGHKIGRAHV